MPRHALNRRRPTHDSFKLSVLAEFGMQIQILAGAQHLVRLGDGRLVGLTPSPLVPVPETVRGDPEWEDVLLRVIVEVNEARVNETVSCHDDGVCRRRWEILSVAGNRDNRSVPDEDSRVR